MLGMYAAVENIEKLRCEFVHRLFGILIEYNMSLGLDESTHDIASLPSLPFLLLLLLIEMSLVFRRECIDK